MVTRRGRSLATCAQRPERDGYGDASEVSLMELTPATLSAGSAPDGTGGGSAGLLMGGSTPVWTLCTRRA